MDRNGGEVRGKERNGMERTGVEWIGFLAGSSSMTVGLSGKPGRELDRNGADREGQERSGKDGSGMEWFLTSNGKEGYWNG